MTESEFRTKWDERRTEFQALGALVTGASLIQTILDDLESVRRSGEEALLSLGEAALVSGYSVDHLGRLVRTGKLSAVRSGGGHGRIAVRAGDLPRKSRLQSDPTDPRLPGASRRQIAKAILTSND